MASSVASAAPYVPDSRQLTELAAAAADGHGCELYQHATQTVFGAGPAHAPLMLVGEQPGDVEDSRGEPFVGPAGKLLGRALREAGIEPGRAYVTNAVKHFRWHADARGKRRIHDKPGAVHIRACRPWLEAELQAVAPELVVALGATAAQSLLGAAFRLTQHRGSVIEAALAGRELHVLATIHPSAVLRAPDRSTALAGLVADLAVAAEFVA